MNRGEITDTEMNNILDGIVDSLFSLFATLGKSSFFFFIYVLNDWRYVMVQIISCRNCSGDSKS